MTLNRRSSIFVILLMLCSQFSIHTAGAQPISHLKLDSHRILWSHLSFHAKNFWVEVSTDLQLKSLRASDLDAVLIASPKGIPIKAQASQVNEMTINTIIDPRFRSPVKIHNRIWFNPADASALGRIRLRRGEDDFKKIYRFTDRGIFRHRIEPKDNEEGGLEPDKWTDVKDTFYPYDTNRLKCPIVSERALLIYLLSASAALKGNESLSLCVFGKRQLHRVQLRKAGQVPIKINYIEKNRHAEIRRKETIMARKITITAQPIETSMDDVENFSFIGLHKDIAIYFDSDTGLPIQVNGVILSIGKAELKLSFVQLNQTSD